MEHLIEAECGAAEQDLGILEALVAADHGSMYLLRHLLDAPQKSIGFLNVSRSN